ncbi:PREDICTED: RPA-interacting protein [Ceratosolen solmsi marchali]|uniref:RPA-interacting protein n=1 Tax=Ceratosolen solmsi marchali TaxID=326594 RepID=A0AAJ6YSF8_9HYME|nr:PREDICTED: RPA-interacting protein [Ceratosolen solmsi marchali]
MSGQDFHSNNLMRLKNVNAAKKIKNGSPKIREILRQRCRQRILERRNDLFMNRRFAITNNNQEINNALKGIVHEELKNILCTEIAKMQNILIDKKEAFATKDQVLEIEEVMEEQWMIEEYDKILWEQKQILSMFVYDLLCPICLKHLLQEISNFVVCECGFKLPVQIGLQGLKENIQTQVTSHSASCLDIPKFSAFCEDDNISLYFSCNSCNVFALV